MSTETAGPRKAPFVFSICVLIVLLASLSGLVLNPESQSRRLVRDLNSPSRARRIWAVQTLGALKDRSAVEALSAKLEDQDPIMRRCAAWALGQINDPRSVKILTSAVKHWDHNVRKEAAASLSKWINRQGLLTGQSASCLQSR